MGNLEYEVITFYTKLTDAELIDSVAPALTALCGNVRCASWTMDRWKQSKNPQKMVLPAEDFLGRLWPAELRFSREDQVRSSRLRRRRHRHRL
jgi:hypothetical protein